MSEQQTIAVLMHEKKELLDKMALFREKYAMLVQSKTQLQQELLSSEESKFQMSSRLQELEDNQVEFEAMKKNYSILVQNTQKEKQEAEENIKGFQENVNSKIGSLQSKVDSLESELKQSQTRTRELQEDLVDRCDEVEELTETVAEYENKVEMLNKQLEKEVKENELNFIEMQKQNKKSAPELAQEIDHRNELQKQLRIANATLNENRLEVDKLQSSIAKLSEEYRVKYADLIIKFEKETNIMKGIKTSDKERNLFKKSKKQQRKKNKNSARMSSARSNISVDSEDASSDDEDIVDDDNDDQFSIAYCLHDMVQAHRAREDSLVEQLSIIRKRLINMLEERQDLGLTLMNTRHTISSLPIEIKKEYGLDEEDIKIPENNIVDQEELKFEHEKEKNMLLKKIEKVQNKQRKTIAVCEEKIRQIELSKKTLKLELENCLNNPTVLETSRSSARRATSRAQAISSRLNTNIPYNADIVEDLQNKYALLQEQNASLKKAQLNAKAMMITVSKMQEKQVEYKVNESALKARMSDLVSQVERLQLAQRSFLQNQPGVMETITTEQKAVNITLKEYQVNIQMRLETKITEYKTQLMRANEELKIFEEFMKVSLLSYQKEILRLRKELTMYKTLAGKNEMNGGDKKNGNVPQLVHRAVVPVIESLRMVSKH